EIANARGMSITTLAVSSRPTPALVTPVQGASGESVRTSAHEHEVARALRHLEGDRQVQVGEALEGDVRAADLHLAEPIGIALRQVLAILGGADVQREVGLLHGQADDEPVDRVA